MPHLDHTSEKGAANGLATLDGSSKVPAAQIPQVAGSDSTAVHTDTAGEIAGVTLKGTPIGADLLLIEDSAAANAKKRITISSLPGGGGGDNVSVNGSAASDANLNDTTPAAPAGGVNVKWQKDTSGPDNISAHLAADDVSNTVLANMAANTVKANPTGSSADPQDVSIGANTVLGRQGGNIVAAQVATGQVANNAITNAKLAQMVQDTIKGRASGAGTGDPIDLTATQATAILNVFTSALKGLAPASGGGVVNFLRADATWAPPPHPTFIFGSMGKPSTADKQVAWIAPHAGTLVSITLWRRTAGTSGSMIVDVNKNGTTIYTTQGNRPTVTQAAGNNATHRTTNFDVTTFAQGDRIEVDIDQVESGNPLDWSLTIEYRR